jgi:hypothetical protein
MQVILYIYKKGELYNRFLIKYLELYIVRSHYIVYATRVHSKVQWNHYSVFLSKFNSCYWDSGENIVIYLGFCISWAINIRLRWPLRCWIDKQKYIHYVFFYFLFNFYYNSMCFLIEDQNQPLFVTIEITFFFSFTTRLIWFEC